MSRAFPKLVALLLALLVGACQAFPGYHKVDAPFDAIVCYNSSFSGCLTGSAARVGTLVDAEYSQYISAGTLLPDTSAGTSFTTSDGAYSCNFGKIPISAALDRDQVKGVVFVPRFLFEQIGEAVEKLNRARVACARVVQSYDLQLQILPTQDNQSKAQKAIQYLTGKIEHTNVAANASLNVNLTSDEINQFGLTPPLEGQQLAVSDALVAERQVVTQAAEKLRTLLSEQVLKHDYKNQVVDAQSAINAQIHDVAALILQLDGIAPEFGEFHVVQKYYLNGAIVPMGATVSLVAR